MDQAGSSGGTSRCRLRACEAGAAAIEYALLASLIALTLIVALTRTGDDVSQSLAKVPPALADGPQTETELRN